MSNDSTDPAIGPAGARARHPGWDIREVFGGWLAVPEGTPVVQAMFLGRLEEKIAGEAGPDAAILAGLAAAHAQGQDIGEFAARALAALAARLGSSAAVLANRPGSWEAALAAQLLAGTVGEDDEDLDRFREPS